MNNKNDCFAYTRVSTAKQGEGVSLQAQKEAIQGFAERNGLNITKWFEEKETAAKSGRPIFSSMMKQLNQHKAGGVIIHKIDRSARNFSDWAKIGELSDNGIDVHFAAESIDFRSRGGRLTADFQAVIAADFIRNLRTETLKGITGRLEQGLWPCKAPMGYCDNGGGKPKTIDPENGPKVRKLFEAYATGEYSYRSLLPKAQTLGIRNSQGNPVQKTCLEKTLTNPFYVGLMHVRRRNRTYQGIHEPLISCELFDRCQEVRIGRYVKKDTKHKFTYRGVFLCGLCGKSMTGERQKGHVYYRCHTSQCSTKTIREDEIEKQIRELFSMLDLSPQTIGKARTWVDGYFNNAETQTAQQTVKMEIAKLELKQEKLTDALIDGMIDKTTYEKRNTQLSRQTNAYRQNLGQIPDKRDISHACEKLFELLKCLSSTYFFADADEKRQFVKILTSNRRVIDRSVYLEPRSWVSWVSEATAGLYGTEGQETFRSGQQLKIGTSFNPSDMVNCEQLQELQKIIEAISPTEKLQKSTLRNN